MHLDRGGIARDHAGMLEKRKQSPPRRMSIRVRKVPVPYPHCQIRQSDFVDRHHLILPMIQFIHGSLFGFEIFQRPEHVSLFFTVAFLFSELGVALLKGPPLFGSDRLQFGFNDGLALLDLPSQDVISHPLQFQSCLVQT